MKEEFLHYVWQHKLFNTTSLKTCKNEDLEVLKSGIINYNSGPDFLNSQIKIDNQIWIGNVEIHVKSSDWYMHNHEIDKNYDAVILHVVWNKDVEVFMKNNKPIPTLELKKIVDKKLVYNYENLITKKQSWIPCENLITKVNSFKINFWLERLFFERLEQKSEIINKLLINSNNDFEAVLFQLLAKNFGLKVNGEAFLQLATSFDFSILRKVKFNELQLEALLFGQAGFLEDELEEVYHQKLKTEYKYLQHKYKLQPSVNSFQFFRMRPQNFPTIRIAQLIALFNKYHNLFSILINIKKLEDFYKLFTIEVNSFWKSHYTFETHSKRSNKKLTKPFVDLLLINTIIPLKFVYLKSRRSVIEDDLLNLIQQIKPEKNTIISKFSDLKITTKNAFETQALLELKNNYCAKKRCLQCTIGQTILKNN